MTDGQIIGLVLGNLVTVVAAIFGSSGYWSYKQRKLERGYEQEDEADEELTAVKDGVTQVLYYILEPWFNEILARQEKEVGIEEYDTLDRLFAPYSKLHGINGEYKVMRRRYDLIRHYDKVPDIDLQEECKNEMEK